MAQNSERINQVFMLVALHGAMFGQERVFVGAVVLIMSELLALSGHRVTDLLGAVGLVGEDWSAW